MEKYKVIEEVKKLIGNGETKKALELLINRLEKKDRRFSSELLLLKSRVSEIERKLNLGVIQENDSSFEKTKINYALLNFLEEIGVEKIQKTDNKKYRRPVSKKYVVLFMSILTIMVMAVFAFFINSKNSTKDDSAGGSKPSELKLEEKEPEFVDSRIYHTKEKPPSKNIIQIRLRMRSENVNEVKFSLGLGLKQEDMNEFVVSYNSPVDLFLGNSEEALFEICTAQKKCNRYVLEGGFVYEIFFIKMTQEWDLNRIDSGTVLR